MNSLKYSTLLILYGFPVTVVGLISQNQFSVTDSCFTPTCEHVWLGVMRSKIQCGLRCRDSSACDGFVFDKVSRYCVLLKPGCYSPPPCSHGENLATYILNPPDPGKVCSNGGILNKSSNACTCVDGWVGDHCERLPYGCEELRNYGYPENDYFIKIDLFQEGTKVFPVHCFLGRFKTFTYIIESDGLSSHNKTFQEFRDGYVIDSNNRFVGLENLRLLYHIGYRDTYVYVLINNTVDYLELWMHNKIKSISQFGGYILDVEPSNIRNAKGSFSFTNMQFLGDVMYLSNGVKFSAYDKDVDYDDANCASLSGAGWWFHNCNGDINPLGLSYQIPYAGPESARIRLPGFNMSDSEVANFLKAFRWFFFTRV